MCVCLVTQSCLVLCDPMDYRLPGSSIYGIPQARILEWVAMPSSRGSSQPRIEPASFASLALAGSCFFTAVPLGSPQTKPTSEQRDLPGKNNELCNDKRVNSRK